MFSSNKIKLEPTLYKTAAQHAKQLGYPSLDDFVSHLLARELKPPPPNNTRDSVLQKMKGLGYLQ